MSLKIACNQIDPYLAITKPCGLNTHRPSPEILGIAEILEQELQHKLFIAHRLDKDTSGTIVFGKTPEAAKKLSDQFAHHQVKKSYYFLTDKVRSEENLTVESYIFKKNNSFVSQSLPESPQDMGQKALTLFTKVKNIPPYTLWRATPQSGKPHQIRLHAQDSGISILGDSEHGGSPYPHLCLHSHTVQFFIDEKDYQFSSTLPYWTDLEFMTTSSPLTKTLSFAIERRQFLYPPTSEKENCLRLVQHEMETTAFRLPQFRVDQLGDVLWVYWYEDRAPSDKEIQEFQGLHSKLKKPIWIRKMNNRGSQPNIDILWPIGQPPQNWIGSENEIRYLFSTQLGLSPGLFLDLRQQRAWAQKNSKNKKVLNLFAYTGGFSLCASHGKAKEVVTVDLSKNFLEWSQRNLQENLRAWKLEQVQSNHLELPPPTQYEFWHQDVFIFLSGCKKRNRLFDLIICDPPSFSRSKTTVFSIEKDLEQLTQLCWSALEPGGQILFSSNFEKWEKDFFKQKLLNYLPNAVDECAQLSLPGLDVHFPGEPILTKSFLLRKS